MPARNEAGNIRPALDRIPVLGARTEVIFVEGNSRDDTWEAIQRETANYRGPHLVQVAEAMGLDTVWLGESHFRPQRAVFASPLVGASAVAARTKRLRVAASS